MRVHDTKGGDFVENPELTMVICQASRLVPLAEVAKDIPLQASPEGLFKRVDIGVNNYDPALFTVQEFDLYFLNDSKDYSGINNDSSGMMMQARTEADILKERIDTDLVAQGTFTAEDMINHSAFDEEFSLLEPGLFEKKAKSGAPRNLKEAKKQARAKQNKLTNSDIDNEEDFTGYRLPLFNKNRTQ